MHESVLQKERGKKHLLLLLGGGIEEASQVGVTRGDLLGGMGWEVHSTPSCLTLAVIVSLYMYVMEE